MLKRIKNIFLVALIVMVVIAPAIVAIVACISFSRTNPDPSEMSEMISNCTAVVIVDSLVAIGIIVVAIIISCKKRR